MTDREGTVGVAGNRSRNPGASRGAGFEPSTLRERSGDREVRYRIANPRSGSGPRWFDPSSLREG